MNQLSLADLMMQRVPLAPREAATLTLAVAREWDRQRTLRGPVALPDIGAITLHSGGEISFLIMPPASGNNDAAPLAALLGQLLGIDKAERLRRPIPGGLLVLIAGRLGQTELPSATPEGFRAALTRFAADDPALLSGIFWRVATASRLTGSRRRGGTRDHPVTERRGQPQAVAVLRREIRELEQRVFESQRHATLTTARHVQTASAGREVMAWVAAVGAVLILAFSLMPIDVPQPVAVRTLAEAPGVRSVSAAPPGTTVAPAQEKPSEAESVTRVIRAKPSTPPRQRSGRQPKPAANAPHKARPVALFPGGTRTIAWLGNSR